MQAELCDRNADLAVGPVSEPDHQTKPQAGNSFDHRLVLIVMTGGRTDVPAGHSKRPVSDVSWLL